MKALTLDEVVSAMGGRPLVKLPIASISAVGTDSRDVRPGELFFAIVGERFNGHDFVEAALKAGAVAAVVSDVPRLASRLQETGPLICVADTAEALGRLAAYHRSQLAAQVIAVVGSNGKTTTKQWIDVVLRARKRGRASPKSFNNHIGVPLTLLSAQSSDEYVAVEIGTNHPGEVAALADIARPDLAVITSIGEEHLEFFGDLTGVAREELSILRTVRPRGFVVANLECTRFPDWNSRGDLTRLTFGIDAAADLRASGLHWDGRRLHFTVNGRFAYSIPLVGAHNVLNALAAIAIGLRFGLSHDEIAAALAAAEAPPMRLERRAIGSLTLINDAYNANPASMRAAFAAVEELADGGRRVFILGDMRELGEHAERCHEELGRAAGRSSAQVIVAVGAHARTVSDGATATAGPSKRIYSFPAVEAVGPSLERILEPGDVVLLKGSRAVRLERLLPYLERVGELSVRSS